jgi:hypothetical protein
LERTGALFAAEQWRAFSKLRFYPKFAKPRLGAVFVPGDRDWNNFKIGTESKLQGENDVGDTTGTVGPI